MNDPDWFNNRPRRLAGDHEVIQALIAQNEAQAAGMSDEELQNELTELSFQCRDAYARIEQALKDYQYPSQAFYVFDRILNRRRLRAEIDRAID